MNKTLVALAITATTALAPIAATAENLIFGSGNVVFNPLNTRFFIPWTEKVNAEAGDALDIRLRHGAMLVNPTNYVDRITDDVIQIGWGMLVFNPGRFPRSLVSTVPFIEGSAEAAALAFCRMYAGGAFDEELDAFVPLFFLPFPQSSAHLNGSSLTSMSDLAGQKVMVGSPIQSQIVTYYGGNPLSINVPEHYQALSRDTANGSFMTYTAFPAFNLQDVTTDHLDLPLGGATGMVFMSRERYDGLSNEARAVIDANSGCDVTREMGAEVDRWHADARAVVEASGGHTFTAIDLAELQAMQTELGATTDAAYADRVPDGAAILAQWKEAMETARREIGEIQ